MSPTKHSSREKRRSFKRVAAKYDGYKLKQILRDIDEARQLGINLYNDISLGQMYSMLRKARAQLKNHTGRSKFVFDDMQDEQGPDDDGLLDLEHRIRRESKRGRK
jgi:hypothetical protein